MDSQDKMIQSLLLTLGRVEEKVVGINRRLDEIQKDIVKIEARYEVLRERTVKVESKVAIGFAVVMAFVTAMQLATPYFKRLME